MVRQRLLRLLVSAFVALAATVTVNVTLAGPAAADGCYTWSRTLNEGMSGSDVTQLQIRIAGWMSYGEVLAIDGDYGSKTKAAVTRFQQGYGLTADGIAGPQTYSKIYELQKDDCSPAHFSWTEVTASATCGSQYGYMTTSVKENLKRAMWKAEALRRKLGDHPITVTSGFRTSWCDELVGGSGSGEHTTGRALDLVPTYGTLCSIARAARYAGYNGIFGPGYPNHNDHVHVDSRSSRSWSAPNCF